jgi:hypothetical protein
MKAYLRSFFAAFAAAIFFSSIAFAERPFYKDVKFPQKTATQYTTKNGLPFDGVNALESCGGALFAGSDRGVFYRDGESWKQIAAGAGLEFVMDLGCDNEKLLVGSFQGFFKIPVADKSNIITLFLRETDAVAAWKSGYLAGTPSGIYRINGGVAEKITEFGGKPVTAIAVDADGVAWIGFDNGIARYDGEKADYFKQDEGGSGPIDSHIRALAIAGNGDLLVGTGKGISRYDRKGLWTTINGEKAGLPYEDVLTVGERNGMLWAGTTIGAERFDGKSWQYFQSKRWLPDDRVISIAVTPDGATWLGTPGGISKIEYVHMTLEEKAMYFEKTVVTHNRHNLISDSGTRVPGDVTTITPGPNDNDGLWTGMYIAAECYRYGATGDPEAKKSARASLDALMFLETVTGIPGFFARSFAIPGEQLDGGEWHTTPDGKWMWKGDTSSDEADGHYYAYSIYYDICADNEEKKMIQEKVRRISNYIVDNDFYLLDMDGEPTTFGVWNPEYLKTRGRFQQGLNSLEILSYLRVAFHITGDRKFYDAYSRLVRDYGYAKHTVKVKINQPHMVNHSDDELTFLAYYPLMKYENNSFLMNYYNKSIQRTWRIERPEKNPLWNFIYAAVMPDVRDYDLEGAVETLKQIPLDLVYYSIRNSQRADVKTDEFHGRFKEMQAREPLPFDEHCMMKWNENPYSLDCYDWGGNVEVATFWLLPYWMGRYYGFIKTGIGS